MVAEVDDLHVHVVALACLRQHPLRRNVGEAIITDRSYDERDSRSDSHDFLVYRPSPSHH